MEPFQPEPPARRADLQLIAEIRALVLAEPPPPLADLEALQARLRPLTDSDDPVVADAAGRLELRIMGAIMTAQGLAMRAMGEKLRQVARWLPPENPGNN